MLYVVLALPASEDYMHNVLLDINVFLSSRQVPHRLHVQELPRTFTGNLLCHKVSLTHAESLELLVPVLFYPNLRLKVFSEVKENFFLAECIAVYEELQVFVFLASLLNRLEQAAVRDLLGRKRLRICCECIVKVEVRQGLVKR